MHASRLCARNRSPSSGRSITGQRPKASTRTFPREVNGALRGALEQPRRQPAVYASGRVVLARWPRARTPSMVTPTASGKTLCYNLPVLNRLLEDPDARAMYLFPTKALAEDQLHELQASARCRWAPTCGPSRTTATRRRTRARPSASAPASCSRIPDMLHAGILPHHTKWAKLFENLRYFVIDELHYCRGVYGSHLANVMRRLKRICEFYGSHPQFICSSATIANPRELAEALTGEPFEADRAQRRAVRREVLRLLQPAVREPRAWDPPQLPARSAPRGGGVPREPPADARLRQ